MKTRMKKPLIGALGVLLVCALVLGTAVAALAAAGVWTTQTCPGTGDYKLFGIAATDADNGWAVGCDQGKTQGQFIRWDGSKWTDQTTPGTSIFWNDVQALDANNVWAVGEGTEVLYYNGTKWDHTANKGGRTQVGNTENYYALDVLSASNIYVVGAGANDIIHHYKGGTTWSDESMSTATKLNGVSAADANNVWACGYASSTGYIYYRDSAGKWHDNTTSKKAYQTATGRFYGIYAVNSTNVWAVGRNGLIAHYNGSNWSEVTSPVVVDLNGINGADANHIWACGNNGTIFFYDGSSWTTQEPPSGEVDKLQRVAPLDTERAWISGDLGTILFRNPNAPKISGINPDTATPGTEVTVSGENFGATQSFGQLTLGDLNPTITSWSDTQIKFTVPDNAVSGPVAVVTPGGTSNAVNLNVVFDTFYFAEGCCRPNFDTYFCIQNTNDAAVNVKLTYMLTDGTSKVKEVKVPKESRATVSAKETLGEGEDAAHDFSTLVQTPSHEGIIVERPMYFNYQGNWSGGHDVFGVTSPQTTYYFAEGSVQDGFDTYYCIMNPGDNDANVKITYMKTNSETVEKNIVVAKHSRSTVTAKADLGWFGSGGMGGQIDFSAKIESTNNAGIIAERPMYFNYKSIWTGGHDVVGALDTASEFYFAEGSCRPGIDPYFTLMNPGDDVTVATITYMSGDGKVKDDQVTVGAHSRATVVIKNILGEGNDAAHDFSAIVKAAQGPELVVERPMYFNYKNMWTGGHDVVGATAPAAEFKFAEGTCRPNFDPYFCIQNPQADDAKVKITYIMGDGTSKEQKVNVGATSRVTVLPKDLLGEGEDAAHDFSAIVEATTGGPIVVERPMYFNFQGRWSGGHDVIGFDR